MGDNCIDKREKAHDLVNNIGVWHKCKRWYRVRIWCNGSAKTNQFLIIYCYYYFIYFRIENKATKLKVSYFIFNLKFTSQNTKIKARFNTKEIGTSKTQKSQTVSKSFFQGSTAKMEERTSDNGLLQLNSPKRLIQSTRTKQITYPENSSPYFFLMDELCLFSFFEISFWIN